MIRMKLPGWGRDRGNPGPSGSLSPRPSSRRQKGAGRDRSRAISCPASAVKSPKNGRRGHCNSARASRRSNTFQTLDVDRPHGLPRRAGRWSPDAWAWPASRHSVALLGRAFGASRWSVGRDHAHASGDRARRTRRLPPLREADPCRPSPLVETPGPHEPAPRPSSPRSSSGSTRRPTRRWVGGSCSRASAATRSRGS